jgi:hypothetical protein
LTGEGRRNQQMQTLHEYMMATKSVEYVIAVAFLAAFVMFWRFVAQRR